MSPAAAYAAMGLVLAGCAVYAASSPVRAAILRARWAWRCRGRPALPERDPLDRDEMRAFLAVVRGWKHPAAAQRSAT